MGMGKRPLADRDFVIYMATNTINGKCYVGATCATLEHRRYEHVMSALAHRGGCRVFNAAIRKYGADAFKWTVLSQWTSHAATMAEEVRVIAALRPAYNMTSGGRGMIGLKRTPEWIAKIADSNKGKKLSPEHIQKLSAARLASKAGFRPVVCLNDAQWFESVRAASIHYSISHNGIIASASGRGVSASGLFFAYAKNQLTKQECDSLIAQRKDRYVKRAEKTRAAKSRPVVCISDGRTYPSGRAAAQEYGLHVMSVVQCCRDGAKTATGLRFRYADEPARDKHKKTKAQLTDIRARQAAGLAKSWAKTQKRVRCIDDGRVFDSITHAADAIGKHVSLVSASIYRKGRCGGLRFEFVENG